ncbi:RHS repeat-associated core domain-containing protein [Sulfurimonas lithotrophica]|nr:RHS repeat-associated core domain-containing protein [Sulfurimonas lithotrophica]
MCKPPQKPFSPFIYTYDANGNRVSATVNGVTTSAYYTLDDQTEVYGDNTYTYDEDGQLVSKQNSLGTTTYTYNTYGTLTGVTLEDGTTIKYHLNPLNQRIAKEVNGVIVEKYLWENLTTLLAILDADDNVVQRYNYSDERVPTSLTHDNQTYYLHYDQVGTLRLVTDANHNIVKEITYDTYGNILNDSNTNFKVLFGFAGGLSDRDTNLVHFGHREYDPYAAKWTTKDPIDFSGGDTNLYGYVLNDPVNFVDPEGLQVGVSGSGGFGAGLHALIAGAHYHYAIKTINGRLYKVHTVCARIGPGIYLGGGLEISTGVEDDCQSSGFSGGVGGDVAFATSGGGASLSGSSSGASLSTGFRGPASSLGIGASFGIDGCYSWVTPL